MKSRSMMNYNSNRKGNKTSKSELFNQRLIGLFELYLPYVSYNRKY
jgi:hypothetical protein